MRAIVLAGGMGTRLHPYTVVLPKPLLPIGDFPILEVIVRQLAYYGFDHITFAVNHQAELIEAFFGDGRKWDIKIDYALENIALGTMGPLTTIRDLPENFIVMNGDVLTDISYLHLYENHLNSKNVFTVSGYRRIQKIDYGILGVGNEGRLVSFKEKPSIPYIVSMGVYVANQEILQYIPPKTYFGFDQLMLRLIEDKIPVGVEIYNGYWLDIGRPDDYREAIDLFEKERHKFIRE